MTLDDLRSLGVNVDEGIDRCLGNEGFYLQMLDRCLDDPKFEELGKALLESDLDAAFELAHALKGVAANLSLTKLHDSLGAITDKLRDRTQMDYTDMYESVMKNKADLDAVR